MTPTKTLLITDRRKIREHWKKSDAQIEIEIGIIRNWFRTQKHLPEVPSDNTIEYFLTNCKFSIEKTKQTMDMFYSVKNLLPDFYENKHPSLDYMKQISDAVDICPMPRLTENLHRITIVRFKEADTDKFVPENNAAFLLRNMFEIKTKEDLTLGEIFVVDFKHLKIGHVVKITPMLVKKSAFVLEKVWANRVKEMHFLNSPSYVDTVLSLARTFFSKKLRERLYVHDNIEDMFKTVPRELMPSEYGGDEISISELTELWKQKFEDYKDRFDTMEMLKVDEDLRPEKLTNSDILGYHGNFKTIEVD